MAALFLALSVGLLKGGQDHLMFHTSSGPDPVPYWGDAKRVWLRRYVGGARTRGLHPLLRVPVLGRLLTIVWDGWHLLALLRGLGAAALVVAPPPALPLGVALALAFALHTAGFYLAYSTLPRLT